MFWWFRISFVLFIFLGSLRASAIVAVMIPLSLLATFIGLTIRGIPANLLSLGAMDFGIIVDGAVIVVENIVRHLSQLRGSPDADTRRTTILNATVQVGRPTFFSMLIIIAAIIYFVSPFDVIPDWIPVLGHIDDAFVVTLALKSVRGDLDTFMAWETARI